MDTAPGSTCFKAVATRVLLSYVSKRQNDGHEEQRHNYHKDEIFSSLSGSLSVIILTYSTKIERTSVDEICLCVSLCLKQIKRRKLKAPSFNSSKIENCMHYMKLNSTQEEVSNYSD